MSYFGSTVKVSNQLILMNNYKVVIHKALNTEIIE
jgi:hypothetical protein